MNDDVNNLRPLSIWDAYANIFERIVLNEVKVDHPDHSKQFGFKPNASCSHASLIIPNEKCEWIRDQ